MSVGKSLTSPEFLHSDPCEQVFLNPCFIVNPLLILHFMFKPTQHFPAFTVE